MNLIRFGYAVLLAHFARVSDAFSYRKVENRYKHIAKVIEHLSHGVKTDLSGNKAGQFEKGYQSQ
jgi:hypothetical protein